MSKMLKVKIQLQVEVAILRNFINGRGLSVTVSLKWTQTIGGAFGSFETTMYFVHRQQFYPYIFRTTDQVNLMKNPRGCIKLLWDDAKSKV